MNKFHCFIFSFLFCFSSVLHAQQNGEPSKAAPALTAPDTAVSFGRQLLQNGDFAAQTTHWNTGGEDRMALKVLSEGLPPSSTHALQVQVKPKAGDEPWSSLLFQAVATKLHPHLPYKLSFWARSPQSAQLRAFVEEAKAPYGKLLTRHIDLTPQWKPYEIMDMAPLEYAAGATSVMFHLGGRAAIFEIAGVRLETLMPRPELDVQGGHTRGISSLALSPDETILATGSFDNSIKLWDFATGRQLRALHRGKQAVWHLSWSPDGKYFAALDGPYVRLWDGKTLSPLRVLTAHSMLRALAWSPDSKILASGTWGGVPTLWNVESGETQPVLSEAANCTALAFSPDGTVLAGGGDDGTLRLWNLPTRRLVRAVPGHKSAILYLSFSPQGGKIASSDDKTLCLWDAAGQKLREMSDAQGMRGAVWSPDSSTVVTGDDNPEGVRLWDVASGQTRGVLPSGWVACALYNRNGSKLICGGWQNVAHVYDTKSGAPLLTVGHANWAEALATAPDKRTLVVGDAQGLGVWDSARGVLLRSLRVEKVADAAFSRDGTLLGAVTSRGEIMLWEWPSLRLKWRTRENTQFYSLALAPDGQTFATGASGGRIRLRSTAGGVQGMVLTGLSDTVSAMAYSPDGKYLAATGASLNSQEPGDLKVWDAETNAPVFTANDFKAAASGVAWSADSRQIVTSCQDAALRFYEVPSGRLLRTLGEPEGHDPVAGMQQITWSQDTGEILAGRNDGSIAMWSRDFATKTIFQRGGGFCRVATFLDGGRRIAGANEDGAVRLWNPRNAELLASLVALPDDDEANRPISADSKPISAEARTVGNASDNAASAVTDLSAARDWLALTPQGFYASSPTSERLIRFHLGEDSFPAECFQKRLFRPDLVEKIIDGQNVAAIDDWKGTYPPLANLVEVQASGSDRVRVVIEATDDGGASEVAWFLNGARVVGTPTTENVRPLSEASRAQIMQAKAIVTDSKAIRADAKAISADAKSIVANSRPLVADSRPLSMEIVPALHTTTRRFAVALPLPPGEAEFRIAAIAFDGDGLQSPRSEIEWTRQNSGPAVRGALRALTIGISQYKNAKINLKWADRDAQQLGATLRRQSTLYGAVEAKTLTNEAATRDAVKAALDELVAKTSRHDTVLVSFSGHGWRSDERTFFFATHEIDTKNITQSALPWRDVVERLTKLSEKSKRVIVLLDACHSGSAANNEELTKAVLSANAGVLIFSSSRGSEVSLENAEWQHGAFTKALLEGAASTLEGQGVTLWDWISFTRKRVRELTEDRQHPQVPFLQDFDTDSPIFQIKP